MNNDLTEPYTHEQLWELAWKWWDIARNPIVDEGTRCGYRECADQLTELLGPLAYAGEGSRSMARLRSGYANEAGNPAQPQE